MDLTCLQTPAWYQALNLRERMEPLHGNQDVYPKVQDNARAARRLQRWQGQAPFPETGLFAERLAVDGVTEDTLLYLLGEPADALCRRKPNAPPWLRALEQAFHDAPTNIDLALHELPLNKEIAPFLYVIAPLLYHARQRLRQGLQALGHSSETLQVEQTSVEQSLFAALPGQLLSMLSRTMVLELHVARVRGVLQGSTGEERFHSFVQRIRKPEVPLELLQEYPVLARQLVTRIEQWLAFSLEVVQHVRDDWSDIRTLFSPDRDLGALITIEGDLGDRHREGRSVQKLRFSSGLQLIYKPKSLAADVHFQELLEWVNQHSDHHAFRITKVIDRDEYGWIEFIQAEGCTAPEQLERFYWRQGAYLALLYALEATDFHSENLIAAGEHPVLIDLEALFHPHADVVVDQGAQAIATDAMTYSVLRVGLLPLRMYAGEDSEGIDLSGLGHAEGQMMPTEQPRWEHGGTDAMRLGRGRVELPTHKNRPTLAGQTVNPLDYIDAICAGFAATYQLLLEHRDTLLTENGLLARFADDEIRVIIRPTNVYGLMQRESFHPDVLRDGLDRDRFFDRLWVGINQRPSLAQLIPFERDDLENGDIPMFTTRPGSRDVWSSSGERITNFLPVSGLALAEQRVRQFSGDDLVRQMWFIRASLTAFARGTERSRDVVYAVAELVAPAEPAQLIAAARAVADRLELLSLRGNQDVTWLGLTILKNNAWSLTQLGPDLYDGLPGIALFLAYLGDVTGENRYTALARTTLDTARQQFAGVQDVMASIGAFDGWGGWIYTLTHLGVLWRKPELLAEAEAVVVRLPQRIKQDRSFDVISGATGCLGALLNLYQVAPSEQTLEAAILCGEHLLTHSVTTPAGRAWNTPIASTAPLTGFSHGAAGMAWALLRLGALTGDERFRTAGLEAVAYERSRFSNEAQNWPDLRDFSEIRPQAASEETPYMTAWCHGAMGIGLARLVTLPYLEPAETKAEIHAALHTTLEQGFGFNHSLCHGDLGNLDLLLHAGNVLRNAAWHDEARRLGGVILASIEHHGWLCGVPLAVETPGLMTGLAGIGYGLLRLAAPARVPSILTLAPPTS